MSTSTTERVRPAAVAGSWYPGEPEDLARSVDDYLAHVTPQELPGRLIGLVVPHAGLHYSGAVAAHAYALLRGRAALSVVLVGPSHRATFDGCAVFARGAWQTPLGRVAVDEALAQVLLAPDEGIVDAPRPHASEHALEMQLPFLQHLVTDLRLVPILMGSQSRGECERLAQRLVSAIESHNGGREVLLVASSDLSHYHPAPTAHRLDDLVLGDIERCDDEGLLRRLEHTWGHACGGGAIVSVLKAARGLGATQAHVLRYGDSGDAGERDKSRVVGYVAAAFTAA